MKHRVVPWAERKEWNLIMKIKEVVEEGKKALDEINLEDSGIISRELLCYLLNKSKQYLVINMNEELDNDIYKTFIENINKIIAGTPIQYITNKQEFMGLEFYVDENVLIPQPDTEILVENVINICNNIKESKTKILDLCTGSGAIAIALSHELNSRGTELEVFASDISENALEVAHKNNKKNNTKVQFIHSDLFRNISDDDFNIIVSNPPYIRKNIIQTLSEQVKNEPIIALDGGTDGLFFYRKIAEQARKHIRNNGYLCLEIGYDQKEEVLNLLKQFKEYRDTKTIKDLSGNDRCIIAKVVKDD